MRFSHLFIAATVGAGALWYASRIAGASMDAPTPLPVTSATSATPAPSSVPGASGAPAPAARAPQAPTAATASAPRLDEQLAVLAQLDNPVMALSAFYMIDSCIEFQRNTPHHVEEKNDRKRPLTDAERREKAGYCAPMTETMKRDRLVYLEKAAKGGAAGAGLAFVGAGPFGDPGALVTRPDDPLVQEWKKQASGHLVTGAHSGDLAAIMYLHGSDENAPGMAGVSPVLRHAAGIALMRIMTAARDGQSGVNPFDEALLQAPKTLSREQLAEAYTKARELVNSHLERKEHDGSRTFVREQPPAVTGP